MKKIILYGLLGLIIFMVLNILYQAGVFSTLKVHSELRNISLFYNVAGPEDLEIDKEKGYIFISSTDRWNHATDVSAVTVNEDGVYLLEVGSEAEPFRLPTTYNGEFHPHGMSFFKKDGIDYLFVINHNSSGNFVELFEFANFELKHLKSFESTQMCCPNDLVAVDVDKFYVTNDHGVKQGLMRVLEDYLRIANSYVLFFDGEKYTKVYEDLNYANGINLSPDKNKIYLTETTGRKLSVLDRDTTTGKLTLDFDLNLSTGLDNITVDEKGNLWIASHPKLLDFIAHSKNNGKVSPSQVLKLTPIGDTGFEVEEVYLNNGAEISASSTALYYQGEVFIGAVFENKILRGTYNKFQTQEKVNGLD
jgi:arylesterase/paraoxonase